MEKEKLQAEEKKKVELAQQWKSEETKAVNPNPFSLDNDDAFNVQRSKQHTIAVSSSKPIIPDDIKLQMPPANETVQERKEREKAERKARMEANKLKKLATLNPDE